MTDAACVQQLFETLRLGKIEESFSFASQERRYEILEFLESIMDAGELADEIATRLIFKNSGLAGLFPKNTEKKD